MFNGADEACPLRHQQWYLRGRTARLSAQRARIDLPAQGRVVVLEGLLRGERVVDDLPALHPRLLVDPSTGREQVLDYEGRFAGIVYPAGSAGWYLEVATPISSRPAMTAVQVPVRASDYWAPSYLEAQERVRHLFTSDDAPQQPGWSAAPGPA